jgi:hypothetical protein
VVDALSLFVGAMPFAVAKSPQSVAVNEYWTENFAVPCIGLELDTDRRVAAVAVVQLDGLPR